MNHGWEKKRLGEICSILNGYAFKSSEYVTDEGIRIIRIANVQDGYISDEAPQFYPVDKVENLTKYILVKDDLLISLTGNVGRVAMLPSSMLPAALNQRVACLRPNPILNREFLFYYFRKQSFIQDCIDASKGIAQLNLSTEWLKEYPVLLPNKNDQEKIVSELDKLNELIEIKRNQLKDFDTLIQSLFYETFGDPIENPKGWETSAIGNVTSVQTGATPSREIGEYFIGDIPWVKTTEVKNCDIYETEEHISQSALENSNCKLFPLNTIIVAMYGQGKTRGQIAQLKIEACTNQACAAILPCSKLNPLFLYVFLRSSYETLRGIAVGCNQKNLNLSLVKNYTIFLPSIQLQNEFAAKVEAIEKQKRLVESSIADLETLLASRMDYWFND